MIVVMIGEMIGVILIEEMIVEMIGDLMIEEMIVEMIEEMIEMSVFVFFFCVVIWILGEYNFFIFDFLSKFLVIFVW